MFKYEVIIYWSKDDNAFIAEVPELAGCMADGETYEKAPQYTRIPFGISAKYSFRSSNLYRHHPSVPGSPCHNMLCSLNAAVLRTG